MRIFISVDVEDPKIRDKLEKIGNQLKATGARIKLVEKKNLHATLKFLGEVDDKELEEIYEAVQRGVKGFKKFEIELIGIGGFPTITNPRVVWIGVGKGAAELSKLASSISRELEKSGYRGDSKPFKPHITIARVKGYGGRLYQVIKNHTSEFFGSMIVDEVRVKRSKLTPQGPIYSTLKSFELV